MDRVIITLLANLIACPESAFGVRDPVLDLVRDYDNREVPVAFAPVSLLLSLLSNNAILLPE